MYGDLKTLNNIKESNKSSESHGFVTIPAQKVNMYRCQPMVNGR